MHVGSYDGLPGAWAELRTWFTANAAEMRGDFLEVYVTDPSEVADPSLNETRLVLPIVRVTARAGARLCACRT